MLETKVLVVDDKEIVARTLAAMVQKNGHVAVTSQSVEDALRLIDDQSFDAVLSDVKMGALGGFDLLRRVKEHSPHVPVILITGEATVTAAMEAMDAGAYDYLSKPIRNEVLGQLLTRAIEHKRLVAREATMIRSDPAPTAFTDIIGHSGLMLDAFKRVARAARGDANVLILGENGTGKERVARALHEKSERAQNPFIAVNVAAIAPGVVESELFGHRRGAFTDAREHRLGLFEQAQGGTLFLDEIGDLDPGTQVKLLRAIQERRIKPVGGNEEVEVDIRLVCATNRDLPKLVREGRFREDLYYRINVVQISLPPLRDRREDVPELAEYFLARFAARTARSAPRLTDEALEVLVRHPWPGNVRELENVMQRAVQFCTDGLVTRDLLMLGDSASGAPDELVGGTSRLFPTLRERIEEYVLEVIEYTGGNLTQASRILGVTRRTLQRMAARRRGSGDSGDSLSHPDPS
jgi:two-component system response regulator HydG